MDDITVLALPPNPISGARESNAGDDFHVLWATRRALGLLDRNSGLELVVVEDLYPAEPEGVDSELLLGVDLTEYFGGGDIDTADRVVVSQLKYSHRHPERSWTAARLAKANGTRPSVVRRLANVYRGLAGSTDRDRLRSILRICLVSNRPADAQLAKSLGAAHAWLDAHQGRVGFSRLLADLDARHHADLKRLRIASNLKSSEFNDFLRVLRLDLGQLPRMEQELAITAALAEHLPEGLRHASLSVCKLVRDRGLPEGRGHPIRAEDVLASLDVPGLDALFPAPSALVAPSRFVATSDAARIIDAIHKSDSRVLLAHGDAGIGKTTSVLQLERYLPEGSVVVILDCFAGGNYDRPAHARHLPERAVLQLCNALAAQCRLPLLLTAPRSTADLWREFERRIAAAAASLVAVGAELLVVVDAIDNAAWAARQRDDPSFVADLWRLQIPLGAGLIATARTGRRDQLALPSEVDQLALTGFDESASSDYLRLTFPEASAQECLAFHTRSQGNPRVQAYVLDPREGSAQTAKQAVGQAHKTPENIFGDLWSSAVEQAKNPAWAHARLADLMCLTPPISVERMADVAGASRPEIETFCHALRPGLRFDQKSITLHDEDFSKYLQDQVADDERRDAHGRLAGLYEARQDTDPYAARVVAEHLRGADRGTKLLALALSDGPPVAIADPIERLQVYLRRIRLALHVAEIHDNKLDIAKLLVLAARAKSSDSAITEIVRQRPGLALRHGDPDAVGEVWGQDRNLHWRGPVHMRLAAQFAVAGDRARAQAELNLADAWIRRRQEQREHWDLAPADLACALHAIVILRGWTSALGVLGRWEPETFTSSVAEQLASQVANASGKKRALKAITSLDVSASLKVRMLVAVKPGRGDVAPADLAQVAATLIEAAPNIIKPDEDWIVDFAEIIAQFTDEIELTRRVLDFQPPLPGWAPSRWESLGQFACALRARALRAACDERELTLEELLPESVTNEEQKNKSDREQQRKAMTDSVGPYIPIYAHRAKCLLTRPTVKKAAQPFHQQAAKTAENAGHQWYEPGFGHMRWVAPMCDALLAARGTDLALVRRVAASAPAAAGDGDVTVWATMARRLITDRRYRDEALELIQRAAQTNTTRLQRASELSDFLLDLAEVADVYDKDLAAELYNSAVEAAAGLDDAGVGTLLLHAHLAPGLAGHDDAPLLAARILRALVNYIPRVSDEEYLPWGETLKAVTLLHTPSGLAAMTRWEDQRHLRLWQSIPYVLPPAVSTGFLTPCHALSLMPLMGEQTFQGSTLCALLDHLRFKEPRPMVATELNHTSLRIRRDLLINTREDVAKEVHAWATQNGFGSLTAITALEPYINPQPETVASKSPFERESDGIPDEFETAADPDTATNLGVRLDGLRRSYGGSDTVHRIIDEAAKGLRRNKREALLATIADLPVESYVMQFHAEHVLDALGKLLKRWSADPTVQRFRQEALERFLIAQLPNLVRYKEASRKQLAAMARLVGESRAAHLAIVGTGNHLDELKSDGLYSLAGQVAGVMEVNEQTKFVDWSLRLLEEDLDDPAIIDTASKSEVLASMLWSRLVSRGI